MGLFLLLFDDVSYIIIFLNRMFYHFFIRKTQIFPFNSTKCHFLSMALQHVFVGAYTKNLNKHKVFCIYLKKCYLDLECTQQ